jgi:hypothetical protein
MKNKHQQYTGLADLRDGYTGDKIDLEDFTSGKYLKDLKDSNKKPIDSYKPAVNNNAEPKKNTLPSEYVGKNWDELYRSNELETIRTQYPEHYEKMRKEKFKTND